MSARLDYFSVEPQLVKAMAGLSQKIAEAGLEHSLLELVKLRASQINGCAFCVDMHARDARKAGETEQRLHLVAVWREASLFSPRERAALAWTEALTRVADTHAPDEDYARLDEHFSDAEKVKLTLLIGVINTWNRIAIGFRSVHPVKTLERAAA